MSRDKVQGFLMGLSAGILVWSFFKIPAGADPSAAESVDTSGSTDPKDRLHALAPGPSLLSRDQESAAGQEVLGKFALDTRRMRTAS
jgi:hypothetical protein